ncbi:MAG: response regulator [Wenzhouxiangella sp.]
MSPVNRILYVEDDPDIQAIAVMALETVAGMTVKACSSGAEALAAAEGFAPDLIVLDVMMPGMDGPTTLTALRDLPSLIDTPVIFVTAKTQSDEIQRLKALGARGVITKPFDPMTLGQRLEALAAQPPGQ